MGKIFCVMGKSAAGKDSLFAGIKEELPELIEIIPFTTRPPREGEKNGETYFFVDAETMEEYGKKGKIIEIRSYNTIHGTWKYATIDDGRVKNDNNSYLVMGTPESFEKLRNYYGRERVVPIYIEVEDGERLQRAVERERRQANPRYEELCRRFLADAEDFSEEKLARVGVTKRYYNNDSSRCLKEIIEDIQNGKF